MLIAEYLSITKNIKKTVKITCHPFTRDSIITVNFLVYILLDLFFLHVLDMLFFFFFIFFFWLCWVLVAACRIFYRGAGSSLWRASFSLVVACRFSL